MPSMSDGPWASVLFVCTGNTCRSPLAEALARRDIEERGLDISVSSAGTMAVEGSPASRGSLAAAARRGVDLSPHRSRPTDERVLGVDLIVAMTPGHLAYLRTAHGRELAAALVTDFLPEDHPSHGLAVAPSQSVRSLGAASGKADTAARVFSSSPCVSWVVKTAAPMTASREMACSSRKARSGA